MKRNDHSQNGSSTANKEEYNRDYFTKHDAYSETMLETIVELFRSRTVKRVLEVGAGTGALLRALREKEFEVQGIDISPVAAEYGDIVTASATDIPFDDQSFDAVLAISIVEHLNPAEVDKFLGEARRVLRSTGLLFIVTPNFNSPMRFMKGDQWFGYSDPTHINFFTPKSLRSVLTRHDYDRITSRHKTRSTNFEWGDATIGRKIPKNARVIINKTFISGPMAELRDSFWMAANK